MEFLLKTDGGYPKDAGVFFQSRWQTLGVCFVLLCTCACMYPCVISVSWSVICCQDGCLKAFAKGALPEEYLSHSFDEQCLGGH